MLPLRIADTRAIALAPVAIDIFFPRYVESAVEGKKKRESARERKMQLPLRIADRHRIVRLICYKILFSRSRL